VRWQAWFVGNVATRAAILAAILASDVHQAALIQQVFGPTSERPRVFHTSAGAKQQLLAAEWTVQQRGMHAVGLGE